MPYRALADFVDELEQAGDLVRVGAEVSPDLELAAIAGEVAQAGGPALLFTDVKGCRAAVAVNLLGTEARICRALSVDSLAQVAERIGQSLVGGAPGAFLDRFKWGGASGDRREPRWVKTGACQQVVRLGTDVDLTALPMLRNWSEETNRLMQAGLAFTVDSHTGARHVERCDVQLLDKTRLLISFPRHGFANLAIESRQKNSEKLPIAVVFGGDPSYRIMAGSTFAAALEPLPLGGLLRGQPVDLVKCRTIEIGVPADADLIVEGCINGEAEFAQVGRPGGFYSGRTYQAVIHATAITERTSPITPAVIPAHLVGETWTMEAAATRIFLPLVQAVVPELVDFSLPPWGGLRRFLVAAIRNTYPLQARRVASALWGWEPLMDVKRIVVVDADVDVHRPEEVWSAVGASGYPERDVFFHCNMMGIDATTLSRNRTEMSADVRDAVKARWREFGLPPLPGG